MSLDDIVRRNRRALGRPDQPRFVAPTQAEVAAVRCCPHCRGEVKLLGVERLAAQTGLLRSTTYQCQSCFRQFDVPNPVALGFFLLGGLGFLLCAVFSFTGTVIEVVPSDRTSVGVALLVLGAITFLWGVRGARTAIASMPSPTR